jgi:hypothetical protein
MLLHGHIHKVIEGINEVVNIELELRFEQRTLKVPLGPSGQRSRPARV